MGEGVEQDDDAAYEWFQAAAEQGYPYAQLFAERMEDGQSVVPTVLLSASRLLHHMGDVFRDKVPTTSTSGGMHIDHKRLQKLRQKTIALGHTSDD